MSAATVAFRESDSADAVSTQEQTLPDTQVPDDRPLRPLVLPTAREPRPTRISWTLVAVGVAMLYLYVLLSFAAPAHPGVDQNGYFVGGRMFASTFSTGMVPDSEYGFVGRMWVREPETGINYPKYPLGLPILFAACIWLFGERGYELAHYISPISAAFATLGVFALLSRLSGGFVGVLGMLLLACGQVMFTLAINPNSHAACTCAVVWGMFFLIRWLESGTLWRGMLAAFLFGFAYLIRYTEGLLLLPLGVAMLYAARWRLPRLKVLAIGSAIIIVVAVVAAIIAKVFGGSIVERVPWLVLLRTTEPYASPTSDTTGIAGFISLIVDHLRASVDWYKSNAFRVILLASSSAAFASLFVRGRALWRLWLVAIAWLVPVGYQTLFNVIHLRAWTSYAGTNESTGFSMADFWSNWEKMIRVLHDQGLFFIAPLGVLGLLVMFRRLPLVATLLALWFLPSVLLYTSYYWAPDNMGVSYSRFILTQLPAMVIAGAWVMGEVSQRLGAPVRVGIGQRLAAYNSVEGRIRSGSPILHLLPFVLLIVAGMFLIIAGVWRYEATRDGAWWALVGIGLVLAVWGAAGLPSIGSARWGVWFDHHFARTTTRLAVGFVVFISCSLGVARTLVGSEWGQRLQSRANLEFQSRQNNNLAGMSDEVKRTVHPRTRNADGKWVTDANDNEVILFVEGGDRQHHLQWVGGWQLFASDAFNADVMQRGLFRQAHQENDPDPIDPSRVAFLREVYKGKDQRDLQAIQNTLLADWIAAGKRIYIVMSDAGTRQFERQVDRRRFEVKRLSSYIDMPAPVRLDETLASEERPKASVNRFGRNNAFNNANFFPGFRRETTRISQVVLKETPATRPTTTPATSPAASSSATR